MGKKLPPGEARIRKKIRDGKRLYDRVKAGKCIVAACQKPTTDGHHRCLKCRLKLREYFREYHHKRRKKTDTEKPGDNRCQGET